MSKIQALFDKISRPRELSSNGAFETARTYAVEALGGLEFPTSKSENWKYTRTAGLVSKSWDLGGLPDQIDQALPAYEYRLVFVNGHFDAHHSSLPENGDIQVLQSMKADWPEWNNFNFGARYDANPFLALNNALASDGAAIRLKKNSRIDTKVGLIFISVGDQTLTTTRNLFIAEEGAELQLSIHHIGEHCSWQLQNSAFLVKENAQIKVDVVQNGGAEAHLMTHADVRVHAHAQFTMNTATLTGKFTRNDLYMELVGQHTETHLNGFYMPANGELVDNHTVIDHLLPHSQSNETYRGILSGNGQGVFNGKVFVRQDAQKTNAFQSNANVLLSDDAVMNSKPELEIYADDVKCSHGSTTGQLDSDALFYLRTRGLSAEAARKTLVQAFAASVIEQFTDPIIIRDIDAILQAKLNS